MSLKYNQQVACLWNASPTIFDLRAVTYNLTSLWVASCELIIRPWVRSRISLHYIKSALSAYIISSLQVKQSKRNRVIWYTSPEIIILHLSNMLPDYGKTYEGLFKSMSVKKFCHVRTCKHRKIFFSFKWVSVLTYSSFGRHDSAWH